MRSHGLYVAPEPLPTVMQMSRLRSTAWRIAGDVQADLPEEFRADEVRALRQVFHAVPLRVLGSDGRQKIGGGVDVADHARIADRDFHQLAGMLAEDLLRASSPPSAISCS